MSDDEDNYAARAMKRGEEGWPPAGGPAKEKRLTDAEISAQYGVEPPKDVSDFWRWSSELGKAAGAKVSLALETKILEQVPQVLDDIRNHPFKVGLTHAKILAAALKIEQKRIEEATRIGQCLAEAQREHAVKAFDEVCGWRGQTTEAPEIRGQYASEREAFFEKLGVQPDGK